jgi:hypothetical protein
MRFKIPVLNTDNLIVEHEDLSGDEMCKLMDRVRKQNKRGYIYKGVLNFLFTPCNGDPYFVNTGIIVDFEDAEVEFC